MLTELVARHNVDCWLVNTGWNGGPSGVGSRMSIHNTRALVRAALDDSLAAAQFRREPCFGLMIPASVPGIPPGVLDPRQSWADKAAYDATAKGLAARFAANFTTYLPHVDDDARAVALTAA